MRSIQKAVFLFVSFLILFPEISKAQPSYCGEPTGLNKCVYSPKKNGAGADLEYQSGYGNQQTWIIVCKQECTSNGVIRKTCKPGCMLNPVPTSSCEPTKTALDRTNHTCTGSYAECMPTAKRICNGTTPKCESVEYDPDPDVKFFCIPKAPTPISSPAGF